MSATPTTCSPSVLRACVRNMVPNLPAPIRPTVTGRPAAFRSSNRVCRFTRDLPIFSGKWQIGVRSESLLADGARHERLVAALLRVGRAAFTIHLRRALEGRRDVDALTARKALRLAERKRGAATIRRAVRRKRAELMASHDIGGRQPRDRASRVGDALGEIPGRVRRRADRFARAFDASADARDRLVEELADRAERL